MRCALSGSCSLLNVKSERVSAGVMRARWAIGLCVWALLSSCDDGQPGVVSREPLGAQGEAQMAPLASGGAWRLIERSQDPFQERAEGRRPCGPLTFGEEYGGVELSTRDCGYITLTQPLLTSLQRGERVEISAWHGPLVSASPAEGLMALSLGQELIWSRALLIPSEAQSWREVFESPVDAREGEALLFHVSNHGANSYNLYSLLERGVHP